MEQLADVASSPTALTGIDVLRTALNPLSNRNGLLTHRLQNLIIRAQKHFIDAEGEYPFVPERGLVCQLRELEYSLRPGVLQKAVNQTQISIQNYFRNYSPSDPKDNDGQVLFFTDETKQFLLLSLIPPRKNGTMPTVNRIEQLLQAEGVKVSVAQSRIDSVMKTVRAGNDVVWCALLAQGNPAVAARLDQVDFDLRVIDKGFFRTDVQKMKTGLDPSRASVREGDVIGRLYSSQTAMQGMDIFGQPIAPPNPEVALELSEDIALEADGTMRARAGGCVTKDGAAIYIVPAYVITDPTAGSVHVSFSGAVIVAGNLTGPGEIECDDLYVLGNCEQMQVDARMDVFIADGVVGHNKTHIDSDGGIYAGFVSEAQLTALGEVVVANAIINSQIISNCRIFVSSQKGMVAGGKLMCLQEIIVPTIGSEFGMLTETVVGRDFLTKSRLDDIQHKVQLNEQNLKRIEELKKTMVRSRVSIDKMSPAKQEIFIGVLRKERASQDELKMLMRRKEILEAGIQSFLEGSIKVLDNLYPPVNVQIGDAEKNIREHFHAVRLTYNSVHGIVSEDITADEKE